jgi:hypothetical protein
MDWLQTNWPMALLMYLGMLALFSMIVSLTYFPITFVKKPADRRFYFQWLLVLWVISFLGGFVAPTLTLFGVIPNRSLVDPPFTGSALIGLAFFGFLPWVMYRMRDRGSGNATPNG